jgi:malate synthase
MEDAATAEIARSQIWQWVRHDRFDREHVLRVIEEESAADEISPEARELFEQVALADDFVEFLTLPAYDQLIQEGK